MNLPDKLKNFMTDCGLQKKWVAKKIGITPATFYNILNGTHPMPERCWTPLLSISQGKIKLGDLMEEKLKRIKGVEVIVCPETNKCEVIIKEQTTSASTV